MLPYVLRIKSLYGAIIFGGDNIDGAPRTQKAPIRLSYGGLGGGRDVYALTSPVVYIKNGTAVCAPRARISASTAPISSSEISIGRIQPCMSPNWSKMGTRVRPSFSANISMRKLSSKSPSPGRMMVQ